MGSVLAFTGMDRLELTTRANPAIFLPQSLIGIALHGIGWIVLGPLLINRRDSPTIPVSQHRRRSATSSRSARRRGPP